MNDVGLVTAPVAALLCLPHSHRRTVNDQSCDDRNCMELLASAWQFIGHLDEQLGLLLQQYGVWIYLILFLIVFCETGLVVAPFLPGDSLLFASGALWASADMRVEVLALTLVGAALSGDNCNYWIGRLFGSRIASSRHPRALNPEGPGADARLLRPPWRKDDCTCAIHSDRAHLRALRRRGRTHDLRPLSRIQCDRCIAVGWTSSVLRLRVRHDPGCAGEFRGGNPGDRRDLAVAPLAVEYGRARLRR